MIDLRKLNYWYSESDEYFDKPKLKKLEKVFDKKSEKKNRLFILKFLNEEISRVYPLLNKLHGVQLGKLFWKKVLFRWYFFLIDNVFINFKVFETLFKKNEKFKIYNFDYSSMTSLNGIKKDPEFYHIWLASEYIRYKKLKYNEFNFVQSPIQEARSNYLLKKNKVSLLKKIYSFLSKLIYKIIPPKYLFLDIGLPFKSLFTLSLRLKQFPFFWAFSNYKKNNINLKDRDKIFKVEKNDEFKNFFYTISAKIFPKIFLEDFIEIKKNFETEFKNKSKYILTQNLYTPEEKIIYMALFQENKKKLILLQHGGLYGTHLFHTGELTELLFADKFFTWGWKKNKKTLPFYSLYFSNKLKNFKLRKTNENKILYCLLLNTRFLNISGDIARNNYQRLKNLQSIRFLLKRLKREHTRNLTLRYLGRSESSGSYLDKNKKEFKNIEKFDRGNRTLFEEINKYKIVIHDCFNTAGLESLTYDKPTLFLINQNIEFFQNSFYPLFKKMIKSKMVHLNSHSLATFLNKNLKYIDKWWQSPKIEKLKIELKKNYVNSSLNYQKELIKTLRKLN